MSADPAMRLAIMEFLQNGNQANPRTLLEHDGALVIGYAMVMEFMSPEGERAIAVLSSDPSGRPLPWYTVNGFSDVMKAERDFDDTDDADENPDPTGYQ